MCELPKVCEHLHLPLQSGSSRILSLMNRKYTFEEYAGKIKLLRNALPGIAITTDIITGFPQEEDADHACTVKALKEICFDGIFAFNYSPRSGTAAAQMEDSVPNDIKAQRLNEILEVQNNVTDYKNKLLEGELCDVLIEAPSGEASEAISRGRTRTNKIVLITDSEVCLPGSTVLAKIVEARRHSLSGVRAG
jgi:tRNA-2-methylthio-N6-dimethylallyladenosine synthase